MEPRLYPESLREYTKAEIGTKPTTTLKSLENGMETIYFSKSTLSRHDKICALKINAMEFLIYSIEINARGY